MAGLRRGRPEAGQTRLARARVPGARLTAAQTAAVHNSKFGWFESVGRKRADPTRVVEQSRH
jgi:hypothetical protein